ncbi:L-rhamnose mutarotase [Pedobacter nototheniae]|uniref:L-rhamnose mutarotase n=1 Tax=Pedobacter nototheniae TaxID=2488994 RepID=UPI00292D9BAA|nr:L-rhamnose mutarotase [Pedobacter nototheniae]
MKTLKTLFSILAIVVFITACMQQPPKESTAQTIKKVARYGSITGLKPEQMAYYKKLHAAVWPKVLKKITECNIHNYSIYLKEIEGKQYLFSYFEYTGNDFAADMKKMASDTTTQRWWKETAPTQIPLPDAMAKGETWSQMEEVFHKD